MIAEELGSLLANTLFVNSPVLSGNMKANIKIVEQTKKQMKIEISAKFYDIKKWKQSKAIIFTNMSYNGITDYPMWVNKYGGFGTHNKSEKWVDNTVYNICEAIANKYDAILEDRRK